MIENVFIVSEEDSINPLTESSTRKKKTHGKKELDATEGKELKEDVIEEKGISTAELSKDQPPQDKDIVARTLLRLYRFLKQKEPFDEQHIIHDLEFNTPNQAIREKLEAAQIELQTIYEENQAVRETSLRTQVETGEQVDRIEEENRIMREKLEKIDEKIKEELEKRTTKYQDIIRDLRNKLGEALKRNDVVTEVTESFTQLQERIKVLFDQNAILEQENLKMKTQLSELEEEHKKLKDDYQKAQERAAELKKKYDLQAIVIAGLKRGEKFS